MEGYGVAGKLRSQLLPCFAEPAASQLSALAADASYLHFDSHLALQEISAFTLFGMQRDRIDWLVEVLPSSSEAKDGKWGGRLAPLVGSARSVRLSERRPAFHVLRR